MRKVIDAWSRRLNAALRKGDEPLEVEDLVHGFHGALQSWLDPIAGGRSPAIPAAWKLTVASHRLREGLWANRERWSAELAASGERYIRDHRQSVGQPIRMVIEDDPTLVTPFLFEPLPPPAEPAAHDLILSFADGRRPAIRLQNLLTRRRATVGRSPEAEISVDDPSISRFHATLSRDEDGRLFVSDCGSANGTLINGSPVTGRSELKPGDELTLGGLRFRLEGTGYGTS
ncbi:MAG: FHA domain-containing protein [Acidobacteria bacterium]|nr:FHA domain-containing protein [Acidobacteriota bacterium]